MPLFAYGAFGPPGSGKSSFCREITELMRKLGRKVKLIDLDPANDDPCYKSDVSIQELITVDDVMEEKGLGYNGALMFCMDYLEEHMDDWLMEKIKGFEDGTFMVMDLPGQVELFTHHTALKKIFEGFEDKGIQMCSVYLVDSHCCTDPGKFIAFLMTTLWSMTHIEIPRINLLSKVDLIPTHDEKMAFGLDYYTQVLDLDRLVALVDDDPITGKYKKLTAAFAKVIELYGLVQFAPLSLKDPESLLLVLKLIDCAVGYSSTNEENKMQAYTEDISREIDQLTAILNEKYSLKEESSDEDETPAGSTSTAGSSTTVIPPKSK